MCLGLVGKKLGMTRVFDASGASTAVTVIEVEPNRVVRFMSEETDGYVAVQVTTGAVKANRINKPEAGHFIKHGVEAGRGLWEFKLSAEELATHADAKEFQATLFSDGQMVDVTGISKGKGFAGTVKRHNFRTQDMTHGNSRSHRVLGSTGQNQTPGRVFKGKKMPGHMGSVQVTTQNLKIVRVDADTGLILVQGAVPGATGSDVIVSPAVKG
ncbi:MAG: 50S ribosomal protein L3 [Gammaproteobacteria bacterium]|nr:50S ribosomal protein L3 [Gammaproteobacteria bacterium]